jgi:hypothetical protein
MVHTLSEIVAAVKARSEFRWSGPWTWCSTSTDERCRYVPYDVTTRKHVPFIQRHAPYPVRRLPGGSVVLATHPSRTLWPLYADALGLLGSPGCSSCP